MCGEQNAKSRITAELTLRRSAELGAAAYEVAEFINVLREQTGVDYALEVRVNVGAEPQAGRNADGTAIVGFTVPTQDNEEEGD